MPAENISNVKDVQSSKKSMGDYNPVAVVAPLLTNALQPYIGGALQTGQQYIDRVPGMKTQLGSIAFSELMNTVTQQNKLIEVVGYATELWGDIPDPYKVTIRSDVMTGNTADKRFIIRAPLQDDLSFGVTSEWVPFSPLAGLSDSVNAIAQLTGRTLMTRWSTRRIWKGTSPITINISLKFEAVYSAYNEVLKPCMQLQQLALPSLPGAGGNPFLKPPGPYPYIAGGAKEFEQAAAESNNPIARAGFSGLSSVAAGAEKAMANVSYDKITISIGKLLKFSNVILKDAQITYKNKFTSGGNPITAKADLIFETYEIMTKGALGKSYDDAGQSKI